MESAGSYIEIPGFDARKNRITKSGKQHTIPLWHPEMRSLLEMVLADPSRNPKCPYLFQRRGKRLKSIRTGFEKALQEAGLDGECRTAVTRMDELEVDPEAAMEMTGHRTKAMYKRYRIGQGKRAVGAGRKLWQHEEQRKSDAILESTYKFTYDESLPNETKPN